MTNKIFAIVVCLSAAMAPAASAQEQENQLPGLASQPVANAPSDSAITTLVAPLPNIPETIPSAPAAAAVAAEDDDSDSYLIGPEDVLDISVWKNPELSRTVPVRPDGKVSLPLVNDIKAAGLTPTALRNQLTLRLGEYLPGPEVSVMVREVHSRKVAVMGSVKTPGRFEMKSSMTVLELIALSQGFTDFANRDRIVVLRQENGKTIRIPFNYRKIAEGATQENFVVQPGDIIVVP